MECSCGMRWASLSNMHQPCHVPLHEPEFSGSRWRRCDLNVCMTTTCCRSAGSRGRIVYSGGVHERHDAAGCSDPEAGHARNLSSPAPVTPTISCWSRANLCGKTLWLRATVHAV
jgi:hypothetical protein